MTLLGDWCFCRLTSFKMNEWWQDFLWIEENLRVLRFSSSIPVSTFHKQLWSLLMLARYLSNTCEHDTSCSWTSREHVSNTYPMSNYTDKSDKHWTHAMCTLNKFKHVISSQWLAWKLYYGGHSLHAFLAMSTCLNTALMSHGHFRLGVYSRWETLYSEC